MHVDNVGAIYLENNAEGRFTHHIDICYHFVRDYVENGRVKIVFVRYGDNKADSYTKKYFRNHLQNVITPNICMIELL